MALNLTSKELSSIEDLLSHELVLAKKYNFYAQQCEDAALQNKCTQMAEKHRQFFNTLMNML